MKENIKASRENEERETKRDERKDDFSEKNVSEPSNPLDESSKCFEKKKNLSDELFRDFPFESSESNRVSNYLHDSNSIFRAAGIISEGVSARTASSIMVAEQRN